jgi:ferritin-like metal-binding protein YciE
MIDTTQELFEHELRDMYDAEHKLLRALKTMADKVPNEELSRGFAEHRKATEGQIKRLEQIFRLLDRKARRETCRGINGLIQEFSKFVSDEEPSEEILNVFAIGAGLKVEQYEIVGYQSLLRLAGELALPEALELLQQNLFEEQETAQQLELMADGLAGPLPLTSHVSDELVVTPPASQEEVVLSDKSETAAVLPEPQ